MPPISPDDVVDWQQRGGLELLDYLLDDVVGADGPFGINTLVDALSNGTGAIDLPSPLPPSSHSIGPFNVTLGVRDLSVSGLNSFETLKLLLPTDDPADVAGVTLAQVQSAKYILTRA